MHDSKVDRRKNYESNFTVLINLSYTICIQQFGLHKAHALTSPIHDT